MILIDMPATSTRSTSARDWIGDPALGGALRHRNAAAYFPRVRHRRPAAGQPRSAASPTLASIAGLYARTDARARGLEGAGRDRGRP